LWYDDRMVGRGRLEHTVPIMFSGYAGLDVGCDNGEVVDLRYEHLAPYPFNGEIHRVTFDVRPPGGRAAQELHEAAVSAHHARHIES
jgi:arylsulfatase